jgi:putative ATPase
MYFFQKSHILYDRAGEEHYNTISALHKSIRASDQNATLYWVTRMLVGGDDPKFICRRLIRAASEDIGLMDSNALVIATSTLQAVMTIGMPESDCIIAQCAVYLARAPKSRLIQDAYTKCKKDILEYKGALPVVPLRLRNISNPKIFDAEEFQAEEGIESCMPSGLESKNYFNE